jgi:hypothetical protein
MRGVVSHRLYRRQSALRRGSSEGSRLFTRVRVPLSGMLDRIILSGKMLDLYCKMRLVGL